MATPTMRVSSTSTSITATIIDDGGFTYFKFSLFYYNSGEEVDNSGGFSTDSSITFNWLDPDTRYSIYCGYSDNGTSSTGTLEDDIWTDYEDPEEPDEPDEPDRPYDWEWWYTKTQDGEFNLTASEWNSFTDRINEFRLYCGLGEYWFTTAYSGDTFTADIYNEAREAIQDISGYGTYIPSASSGDTVTAYHMNILESELNAIP